MRITDLRRRAELRITDLRRRAELRIAERIVALPKDEPVEFVDLLTVLRYPKGGTRLYEGGVLARLACEPIVRQGDLIEIDATGRVRPFPGGMAVIAYDAGDEEFRAPRVALGLVFEARGEL